MIVVSLCDRSGVFLRPWAEAGWDCIAVDVQHSIRRPRTERVGDGSITYQWGDVRTWVPSGRVAFLAGWPPCTHVAVSGARDFRTKGTALLRDSLELFSACYSAGKWSGAPFFIENPVGKFSDHMGTPDYTFHPWEYGDPWTKKTCLWTGGGFVMPPKQHAEPPPDVTQKIWTMPPSEDRADLRSETPPGFARAVFQANAERIRRAA